MTKNKTAIIAYIPVLHQGYVQFFAKHPEAKTLFLIGPKYLDNYRSIQKDLRALSPDQMKKIIEALNLFDEVLILDEDTHGNVEYLNTVVGNFIIPQEEVSQDAAKEFLGDHTTVEVDSIFLRWDRTKSLSGEDVEPDVTISTDEFDKEVMKKAYETAEKSSDWWRQTASVLVKDGEIVALARNYHVPNDFQQYVDGDPRAEFGRGEHIDLSSSLHAESALIAEAASKGISTKGASLYATTFPCPFCAPIIAQSGISKLYYSGGYSVIHGADVLRSKGIEIIKVELE